MADNDSDFGSFVSASESSDFCDSSDDDDTENISDAQNGRGKTSIWREIETRGGLRPASTNIKVDALSKYLELKKKWKREDDQPLIPRFTGEAKINTDVPKDAEISFLANIFLTNELFGIISHQTNLYAHQYRERYKILPRHSRASKRVDVTIQELEELFALMLLTGILQKLEINHERSRDLLSNETMPRNTYQTIL